MLPKRGTFSLIPLWYMLDMNKAFVGGQRCFCFFLHKPGSLCLLHQTESIKDQNTSFFWSWQVLLKHPCNAQWGNEMVKYQPASACLSAVKHGWLTGCQHPYCNVLILPFLRKGLAVHSSTVCLCVCVLMHGHLPVKQPLWCFHVVRVCQIEWFPQLHDYLGKLLNEIPQKDDTGLALKLSLLEKTP